MFPEYRGSSGYGDVHFKNNYGTTDVLDVLASADYLVKSTPHVDPNRLGIYGQDNTDPAHPKMVHAFMPRDTPGYTIKETWDTLGMRATRSDDTLLAGAFVPHRYIVRVLPPGLAGADRCVLAIFAWAEPTFGAIYLGLAEHARDLAVAAAQKRTSVAFGGRAMAYNPMVQYAAAEMTIALEAPNVTIECVAHDWAMGVDHGGT